MYGVEQERVIKRHRSSARKKKREESFCNYIGEKRLLKSYLQMMVKMNIVVRFTVFDIS